MLCGGRPLSVPIVKSSAFAFASGMGAISGVPFSLLQPGDHVVAQRCLYGGTYAVFSDLAARYGIEVEYVRGDDAAGFERLVRPTTRVLHLETIANPTGQPRQMRRIARQPRASSLRLPPGCPGVNR